MQLRQLNRGNRSIDYTLPAPIGGLNARDSLDAMDIADAIVMDNYYPNDTRVSLRKGYREYANIGATAKTLVEYKKYGNNRFIAVAGDCAYDLSFGSARKIGDIKLSNDWCQTACYKDRLFLCNGVDTPKVYYIDDEGEHFADWGFSAVSLIDSKIINIAVSKERLWFVEQGTLKVWYAELAGNISGELKSMDFSSIVSRGGTLQAVASWTQDGGSGIDDLTVFVTSEGETLVYAGSDPSNPADWGLRGKYYISKPIGYRCTMQYQGDVVIITEDGYIPLAKALPLQKANASQIAFSDKIRGLVLERTKFGKNKDGWQAIIYPAGGYAIFNVPFNQYFEQHIFNLNTGAAARFIDIRAFCWGLYNDRLYFGSDEGVYLFDEGYSDNGKPIFGHVEQAFNNLGTSKLKKLTMLNPRTKSSKKYALTIYTNMDFEDKNLPYKQNIGVEGISKWSSLAKPTDTKWGSKWATLKGTIKSQWLANSASGFKASVVFKTKTKGTLIDWYDTGIKYEQGSGL